MTKLVHASLVAVFPALLAVPVLAQDNPACGRISIAEMNWASAGVAAWIDKIVLEAAYGCTVDLVTGDTLPTFTSMNEKGEPDIAPEFWLNAIKEPLETAMAEGRLVSAARILPDGGIEGWWIPKYVADAHPEITSVQKALEHPELFPAPEHPERGGVLNCPSGWVCQTANANLFRALGAAEKGFDLVDSGSAAGLDGSLSNAYERKAGWLGYYWEPTALLGKYEMVRLSFGAEHDEAEFTRCTSVPDCPDPKVTDYPKAEVYTIVARKLAETNPVVMDYLGRRSFDNDMVNAILAWMDDNQATNEDAAWYFFETYPEVWKGWLDDDAVQKVEAAL